MATTRDEQESPLESDPVWFKDAIIYELHVRAFQDSDGDGMGDFRGLTQRLDYLQDLGVTALWLLPFYPSPLRDDGYDIADYAGVHPSYGTLADVETFIKEAHRRGLRVITELVCNHTSDQHPWFQRARRAPRGSADRDFYVWSDSPDRYREARIIFKDFELSNWTLDPVAGAYYWHRFYSHQPDLNFDNPAVHQALFQILDFWLGMGVDGLRLDAVPYLYEREGTTCENLPETHAFLKLLRRHIDERHQDRMLLAEANQWPEEAAAYFGAGDQCHMSFHFPVMPRLFMALQMEDRFPIIDILRQTPPIPETCQWALFLRNHDELTLEMVTDEERDYMYQVYAADLKARVNLGIRRRLAPLLAKNRPQIELMNGLLFSLPGTPVVYYGDEIGMGDNIYLGDRNGVRTPMQWSTDRNAGFSRANPQRLYLPTIIDPQYHYEAINVEVQQENPSSLLWWMKRLIALRKRYRAFGRGALDFLYPENHKILAFTRRLHGDADGELLLCVFNLSRHVQGTTLDLGAFRGHTPVELFGRVALPPIGAAPYFLTLSPYSFYWFLLEPPGTAAETARGPSYLGGGAPCAPVDGDLPIVTLKARSGEVDLGLLLVGRARERLAQALPVYLSGRRWFGGKSRRIRSVEITAAAPVPALDGDDAAPVGYLTLVRVDFSEGDPETYVLPLCFQPPRAAEAAPTDEATGRCHVVRLASRAGEPLGFLYDPLARRLDPAGLKAAPAATASLTATDSVEEHPGEPDRGFALALLRLLVEPAVAGALFGEATAALAGRRPDAAALRALDARLPRVEQSNTSVRYDELFQLKLFRRVEPGESPEHELGRYLTEQVGFGPVAPTLGALRLRARRHEAPQPDEATDTFTLALLHGYVAHDGDCWRYALDALGAYFNRALAVTYPDIPEALEAAATPAAILPLIGAELPKEALDRIGSAQIEWARLLGQRVAELHLALCAPAGGDERFTPEPFTPYYQRSIYQTMRALGAQVLAALRRSLATLPSDAQGLAQALLAREDALYARLQRVLSRRLHAQRTRYHGDLHLGQVLYTGKDFVFIDFEGEPARRLSERRLKRSPLRDVAGMLRSLHYAAQAACHGMVQGVVVRPEDQARAQALAQSWVSWLGAALLRGYLAVARRPGGARVSGCALAPEDNDELETMLSAFTLEKALYELGYELNNRPAWARIALQGILDHLSGPEPKAALERSPP